MKLVKEKEELIEEWDWIRGTATGQAVPRKKAHKEGIAHEGVHLWIITMEAGLPSVLFQHRASDKDMYPDFLDITVGGHVPFGMVQDKIQKESHEEIGIYPDREALIDLGYYQYEEITDDMIHREFQQVYILFDDRPLTDYTFTDGEVTGICAVPLDKLIILLKQDIEFEIQYYNGKKVYQKQVTRSDFHPLLFAKSMNLYMEILIKAIEEQIKSGVVTIHMPGPACPPRGVWGAEI